MPLIANAQPDGVSAEAKALYGRVHDKVLQIRVLHRVTESQASTGSGFVVSADGLALTNYHVVARAVREPAVYAIEYIRSSGEKGRAEVRAFDVANDLAVVALQGAKALPFLSINTAPVPKGERTFSMGHPLQLGLTIVEGTYNGIREKDFRPQIHYSGAVNPGMSGGPTLAADGQVIGINVAVDRRGQLASLLVPPVFAKELVGRAAAVDGEGFDFGRDVGRQLLAHQDRLLGEVTRSVKRTVRLGRYEAAEFDVPYVRCWGGAVNEPKRLFDMDWKRCQSETSLFVYDDIHAGDVSLNYQLLRASGLGPYRFARLVQGYYGNEYGMRAAGGKKEFTPFRCHDDFVQVQGRKDVLRVALCSRAYRAFPDLYDFHVRAVTLDSSQEALVASLSITGASFENGVKLARLVVESISWTQ